MGCCQSENINPNDFKSEIVTYEKREEHSNIFEDNFYLDSVERYNVKYKPPTQKGSGTNVVQNNTHNSGVIVMNNGPTVVGNNANINGGSGASGGVGKIEHPKQK
jgi:hypothetical protein